MSILRDLIFSSTSFDGFGIFSFDELDFHQVKMIKDITKRQRAKFKKKDIIPLNALLILHDLEMLMGPLPTSSMTIFELAEHLSKYGDGWLYDQIIRQELHPRCPVRKQETFIKTGRQFMSRNQIRETMPGAMV